MRREECGPLESRQGCAMMWSMQMGEAYPVTSDGPELADALTFAQREVLERAVAKIILLGARVGVGADHMILLLKSGLTPGELVEYLAARGGDIS